MLIWSSRHDKNSNTLTLS